ncbi:MOSC domain-containing protein [Pseudomonas sp. TKO26]|uniref:MOSC domain-containing protein YiiM n=1 Tax=Pseudomonas saponiphila TaxID=556534 RepID=A0A1H4JFC1_9PSED|nr:MULTISPECIES: MOSC domain-containing protein [Pseudomonas]PYY84375.1 MOSC domain-containing protein [Pseudomonas sp. TKO30]PYY85977.1 MOSC domain-containing protein [Pseudomonas sp. TKO29]PYY88852.1 MOSC domain-containing protein [Pseudomonas sp. TKO26]PYY98974.1 MOSC domain-containing protein [Pseudomonas sp. TKO14]SEB44262.1 MOSC domain-containing protein YiiM [Pseudomonas saponiphila]
MNTVYVDGVYIGKAKNIGQGLVIDTDKHPVANRLWLWPQGLGSDEQGDPRFHTGPERALHHYPAEHYAHWRKRYPQFDWAAPAFGENLSTRGLTEEQVCLGDMFRWGGALLQVSQPRSPCYRLSQRWGLVNLPRQAQDNGRCGWFYRVLKPGFVQADEPFELIQRSYPGLTVAWALRCFFQEPLEPAGLKTLIDCPALSSRWRDIAIKRLRTGRVEDWSSRLLGLPLEGLRA